ncbi:hypothetical protein PR003_g4003 [Phytophthora rubi]|uniref:Peptidase C1A papain C-terminal domain-containing protein n=1 Tax=Phytophthora rubi TaxID=129364 RepID=A0A6A4FW66_9STRA|nr:hypothetical protein PR002_g4325 [Phytophthora rubi]KAE9048064.1 hypothetical protein PR001_g3965 [Phytophthora rubi]KAE9353172.1 hypothetical protein PR003_g4003 [Phytophthora rubi]
MHADIDYHRYHEEKDSVQADLDEWRSMFGDVAQKNGWMPVSEDRSADDQEEDLRQRIFLTKQSIASVQVANPDATFSIMSPFSAMTNDEFNTYVMNSYIRSNSTGGSSGAATRQLRSGTGSESTSNLITGSSDTTSWMKTIESLLENLVNGLSAGTVQPASDSSANVLSEGTSGGQTTYQFSNIWDWRPHQKPTPTPTTSAPSSTSSPTLTEKATVSSGSVDWSTTECVAPIQSQGSCGSCWAFATVSAVESAQCIANGKTALTKYSEQQLVSCNSQNWGCGGGAPEYALDYVQQNGLCTDDSYPYTSDVGYAYSCNSSCEPQETGLSGYSQVSGEDELLSAIEEHPVIVAVASGNNVWKQYTGGVVSSCDTWELDHAVVAVGYDSSSIKIRNSWGTCWGEDGYMRLARSSSSQGTCGVTSDMSTPKM